jgi:hypothetical protein
MMNHPETIAMNTAAPFELGRIVATPNLIESLEARGLHALLRTTIHRHALGDWGDVSAEDAQANTDALKHHDRLFSVYKVDDDLTIWIITEADRSVTTALLPEDY